MTMLTREGYRSFLAAQNLQPNTINSYCSGLEHLAKDCGKDIYTINNVTLLNEMMKRYGIGGEQADRGNYGNGAARNALRLWLSYVEQNSHAVQPNNDNNSWLFPILTENIFINQSLTLPVSDVIPERGDTIFLLRTRQKEWGIIAHGTVNAIEHNGSSAFINCILNDVRTTCEAGLLPLVLLLHIIGDDNLTWVNSLSAQNSLSFVLQDIKRYWYHGKDVHSLKQYVDWRLEAEEQQLPTWEDNYKRRVAEIVAIRDNPSSLSPQALRWIWQEADNGVSSVAPGWLPIAEFEKNVDFLHSATLRILNAPTAETRDEVLSEWDKMVGTGQFQSRRPAVLNRVFSVSDPTHFTTITNDDYLKKLLMVLNQYFALPSPPVTGWVGLNKNVKDRLADAGLASAPVIETNIVMWQLFKEIEKLENVVKQLAAQPADQIGELPKMMEHNSTSPLNQILFGPPGTGKTYATIEYALAVLEPSLLNASRHELKMAFDRYVKAGQIVFTTFHQSYTYEDFVEGIRAVTDGNGKLKYLVEDGIFKKLCARAKSGLVLTEDPLEKAFEQLRNKIDQTENGLLEVKTVRGNIFKTRFSDSQNFLIYPDSNPELEHGYTANTQQIRQLYLYQQKPTYSPSYVSALLNYLIEFCGLPQTPPSIATQPTKKFVLIIDEINRGNVSSIFGELITLLEPSKRNSASEALSVTLPYSRDIFSVPDNVYLIGTMNTSDRSLSGIDIALRRRFTFNELMPKPELLSGVNIEGIDIEAVIRILNKRIEILLDRDHLIGHAFFMHLRKNGTIEQLATLFSKQILPLLQEYFFDDWQRIQWVLNDHRKNPEDCFIVRETESIDDLFGDIPFQGHSQGWKINMPAFNRPSAYINMINVSGKQ
ncbi:McrB family protein [Pseudenterobacter timonensis]|uniref:McrB family protein n=1 Tax=Pseudenterobacter timonensis TaxID=1755099 RepID=A0ABV4A6X7_9ENTR